MAIASPARRARERGFTLIELMVSLVLFSVAVAGVLSVAVTMSGAFRDQRALTQTENAARSPMDFLADVMRNASPGVQSGAITDGYAAAASALCGTPSAIVVNNNYTGTPALTPAPTNNTDTLEVIYASGAFVTSTTSAYDGTSGTGALGVRDISGFAAGDYLVITNLSTGILVKIASITAGTAPAGTLNLTTPTCTTGVPVGSGYAIGSLVVRAMHARFYVATFDGAPNLMMQLDPSAATLPAAQPVADGVEDLQVAVAVDANNDGQISEVGSTAGDDEWSFNVGSESQPAGSIRAVRISLIARAVQANTNGTTVLSFTRPAAEDHAAGSAADNFRRRVLQSTIEIRNLGGSP